MKYVNEIGVADPGPRPVSPPAGREATLHLGRWHCPPIEWPPSRIDGVSSIARAFGGQGFPVKRPVSSVEAIDASSVEGIVRRDSRTPVCATIALPIARCTNVCHHTSPSPNPL